MVFARPVFIVFSFATASFALYPPQARQIRNNGIHLAVSPNCGALGGTTADVNAGINPSSIKTIVSFGVTNISILIAKYSAHH